MGIRPEDLHDDEAWLAANPKAVFSATIRVYEMLGAEVYLYFNLGETSCTARVNPRTTARPGDTIKLAMDLTKIHVFDKDSENVILN
jgi:multiple sugar transport system ATP-binding protein